MSQFTTPCRVEVIGNNLFSLIEPFEYHVGQYPSRETIIVPEGFITDFASVPRIFWSIISPIDKHAKAAVLHDFLYVYGGHMGRKRCDDIFLEAMTVLDVDEWRRQPMYRCVRMFSWYRWNQLRKEKIIDIHKR